MNVEIIESLMYYLRVNEYCEEILKIDILNDKICYKDSFGEIFNWSIRQTIDYMNNYRYNGVLHNHWDKGE